MSGGRSIFTRSSIKIVLRVRRSLPPRRRASKLIGSSLKIAGKPSAAPVPRKKIVIRVAPTIIHTSRRRGQDGIMFHFSMDDSKATPGPAILLIVLVAGRRSPAHRSASASSARLRRVSLADGAPRLFERGDLFWPPTWASAAGFRFFGSVSERFRFDFWALLTHQFLHAGSRAHRRKHGGALAYRPASGGGVWGDGAFFCTTSARDLPAAFFKLLVGWFTSETQARVPLVGASGAIFGLVRSLRRSFLAHQSSAVRRVRGSGGLGGRDLRGPSALWSGLAELGAPGGGVGYWAHVGGFGVRCGPGARDPSQRRKPSASTESRMPKERWPIIATTKRWIITKSYFSISPKTLACTIPPHCSL